MWKKELGFRIIGYRNFYRSHGKWLNEKDLASFHICIHFFLKPKGQNLNLSLRNLVTRKTSIWQTMLNAGGIILIFLKNRHPFPGSGIEGWGWVYSYVTVKGMCYPTVFPLVCVLASRHTFIKLDAMLIHNSQHLAATINIHRYCTLLKVKSI